MKKIVLGLLCSVCLKTACAQFEQNHALYLSNEVQIGNYFGLESGLNYIYKGRTSFKLAYSGVIRNPRSEPEDFNSGLTGALLLGLTDPWDQLEHLQLTVGRIYSLNEKGTLRFNLNAGIGLAWVREPINWERVESGTLATNYAWDYNRYSTISFVINPKLEIPFTHILGLSVSPLIQINKDRVYFGIGIGTLLGVLRPRKVYSGGESSTPAQN